MLVNMLAALTSSSSRPAVKGSGGGASTSEMVADEVSASHVLTIRGYSKTKGVAYGEFITAATFDAAGHRWSIIYYPNGYSYVNSDYISLYLNVDSSCGRDVVRARVRFTLLDENGELSLYSERTDDNSSGKFFSTMTEKKGISRFIMRHALEKSNCLVDDCFSIRCDITVLKVIRKDKGEIVAGERFVVVPASNIDQDLGHLLSSGKGVDVSFEVDGEAFGAHRSILAARSPVFMAEFFSPMKEKDADCVRIDDMEARVFGALLHFVYTDALPEIEQSETMVMVQHLLVAADRYSMERLKLICEDKLCNYIDTSSVGTIMALAEQHGCHGLKKACFQFLMSGNNLNVAIRTDGFDHLANSCPSILKELLSKITL